MTLRALAVPLFLALLFGADVSGDEQHVLFALWPDPRGPYIEAIVLFPRIEGIPNGEMPPRFDYNTVEPVDGSPGSSPFGRGHADDFARTYFLTGKRYQIVGTGSVARVRGVIGLSCSSMAAAVTVPPQVRLPKEEYWAWDEGSDVPQSKRAHFATDDPKLTALPFREATAAQKKAAIGIARKVFAQQKVSKRDMATFRADVQLLDIGDGEERVVASFVAKRHVEENETIGVHQYFLIARPTPEGLVREVEGNDALLGAFDFDRDGRPEIIAFGFGLESHSYVVYSRKKGKWDYTYAADAGC
jgi:hypothetical protein